MLVASATPALKRPLLAVLALATAVMAAEHPMANDSNHSPPPAGVDLFIEIVHTPERGRVDLSYRVRNRGDDAVVLHNRGSALGSRLSPDRTVPEPDAAGDLVVEALPLPAPVFHQGRTGPYQPPASLAMRLDAGAEYEASFVVNPPAGTRRLRFCLGVSPYDAAEFPVYTHLPRDRDGVELLRSPDREQVSRLDRVCSDWLDLAG